jgi:probable phosphoglycerate mutase
VKKRVLLIRHGQTDWNSEGRWQGTIDTPLNAAGVAQARALATYLAAHRHVGVVYSSTLMRAAETGRIVAEALGVPLRLDDRLRELNLGAMQGLTMEEMTARFPDDMVRMRTEYMDFVFPHGESRRMLQDRAMSAFHDIIAAEPEDEIAIVTHGGVKRMIVLSILGEGVSRTITNFGNTSVTLVEQDAREALGWRLIEGGSVAHLEVEKRTDSDSL